jgi:hypothetical protein
MYKSNKNEKCTLEKLLLFRSFFTGLKNVYGTYDPASGRACQVKAPVTDKVLLAHLAGRKPYGVYLLVKDRTRAIAVDFDINITLVPMDFVSRAKHYGMSAYIERSKSKGYHVWVFFEEPGVLAKKARLVVRHILKEISHPDTEVFPKQDLLGPNAPYGNFIFAPMFGALVPQGKTVFVNPATFEPYLDQWDFLESVTRTDESTLDDIIELNDLSAMPPIQPPTKGVENGVQKAFMLPPCARKMFKDGVTEFQRVSAFRLAIHLKRLGLPFDVVVSALKTWALKNRPANGKRVIIHDEIVSQASDAFSRSYTGFGCESEAVRPFCDPSCWVKQWLANQKGPCTENTKIRK